MYLETTMTVREVISRPSHLSIVVVEQEEEDDGRQRCRPRRGRRPHRRVVAPAELGLQLVVEEVVELLHFLLVDPLGERLVGGVLRSE